MFLKIIQYVVSAKQVYRASLEYVKKATENLLCCATFGNIQVQGVFEKGIALALFCGWFLLFLECDVLYK